MLGVLSLLYIPHGGFYGSCLSGNCAGQEPVSGLEDIKAKIEHLGLGGAMVDLGCGSVDAQPSEGGDTSQHFPVSLATGVIHLFIF